MHADSRSRYSDPRRRRALEPSLLHFSLSSFIFYPFSSARHNCQSRLSGPLQCAGIARNRGANTLFNAVFAFYPDYRECRRDDVARIPILSVLFIIFFYRAASFPIVGEKKKIDRGARMEKSRRETFFFR